MSVRVAVVHDYLTQRGGAERVVLAIRRAFPGARLITSVYDPGGTFPEFADFRIETSWLQRVPAFRHDPRKALPLLPGVFSGMRIDDVDVVICSSSGWAHAVQTSAAKIVYCHNPARWLYQQGEYTEDLPRSVRTALQAMTPRLTAWDKRAAATATRYLVNSTVVRDRVRQTYGIQADVLPPPVVIDAAGPQEPSSDLEPGYFLVVSRARGYKNIELACEAFRHLPDQRLVVVGGLPDTHEPWPANICGVTDIPDTELRWLYENCAALIAIAHEDFGLTPLESNAFGRPAIVLRAGGFLDTMSEGLSGHFVEELLVEAVVDAVRTCLEVPLDRDDIRAHAAYWSRDAFEEELHREVDTAILQHLADRRRADRRAQQLPLPQGMTDRRTAERRGVAGARWPRQRNLRSRQLDDRARAVADRTQDVV